MYIASSASDVSALLVVSLYGSTSTNTTQALKRVQCRAYVNTNVTKQQYSLAAHRSFLRHVGKLPGTM